MQTYIVDLQSSVSDSFRCQKAANSLDIDVKKKLKHVLKIDADLEKQFNLGLIVGSSGSGKTTLAKKIYGNDCFTEYLDLSKTILDQMPKELSYDDCVSNLLAMGLGSVPCWLRPTHTLSNGQRARAEAVLQLTVKNQTNVTIIDEWTSVVDRTVAKAMSNCIQKASRKLKKTIILLSCHYDVIEWLNPDWIIDCNKQKYEDRRSMVGTFERTDRLRLDIRKVERSSWRYFSKYHYLSDRLPGGEIFLFGLFHNDQQIGFQCFAGYVPGKQNILHFNRTVIHPDYVGLGLGIKLINETSQIMAKKGYKIMGKFSNVAVFNAMKKYRNLWKFEGSTVDYTLKMGAIVSKNNREKTLRKKVRVYRFRYIGKTL